VTPKERGVCDTASMCFMIYKTVRDIYTVLWEANVYVVVCETTYVVTLIY